MKKNSFGSIKRQAVSAIRASFKSATGKHASKGGTGHQDCSNKLYSYALMAALIDLSRKAFPYIKSQHKDIRCIKDVTVGHINEFLESEAGVCSPADLSTYATMFKKIALCVNHFYQLNLDWEAGLVMPRSRRTTAMRHFHKCRMQDILKAFIQNAEMNSEDQATQTKNRLP